MGKEAVLINSIKLGVVMRACNPSTGEAKAGRLPKI